MNLLTHKQRRFAEAVAGGFSYSRAYREVYSNRGSRRTTAAEASRVANLPKVAAEIEKLATPITPENSRLVATRALFHECRHGENSETRLKAAKTLAKVMKLL